MQPADRSGFLTLCYLHELIGLPLKLDLFRIDDVELLRMMPNTGANLPGH